MSCRSCRSCPCRGHALRAAGRRQSMLRVCPRASPCCLLVAASGVWRVPLTGLNDKSPEVRAEVGILRCGAKSQPRQSRPTDRGYPPKPSPARTCPIPALALGPPYSDSFSPLSSCNRHDRRHAPSTPAQVPRRAQQAPPRARRTPRPPRHLPRRDQRRRDHLPEPGGRARFWQPIGRGSQRGHA